MMSDNQLIDRQIEFLRGKLIDLTNRNRLTNFKHSDRSRTHLRIIDELPDAILGKLTAGTSLDFRALPKPEIDPADEDTPVFRRALAEAELTDSEYLQELRALDDGAEHVDAREGVERRLRDRVRAALEMPPRPDPDTMSAKDYARSLGIDPDYELPEPVGAGDGTENHHDNYIQTLLHQEPMDRKLSGIHDRYRLSLQELGINTLYTCFGFLEWTARDDSNKRMLAPLVLQQVDLEKKKGRGRYRYILTKADDESTVNLALEYRLKHEYGLQLPAYRAEDSVESYLTLIREAISSDHASWRVRRFVTIGHFSFAKLAMYHDLGSSAWRFDEHSVVRDLLLGTEPGEGLIAPTIDIDEHEKSHSLPLTIADADSSQLSAVIDVVSGKSLAIKGPPGTGKSQTITNVIAAAIDVGKTVLFVAEKNAALEVVKKRLDDAEIGDFCLELHSTKSNKKALLNSIERRLELQNRIQAPENYSEQYEDLRRTKIELNRHYEILVEKPFKIGLSILDILWAVRKRDDVERQLPSLRTLNLPAATAIDRHKFEDACERLDEYSQIDSEIGEQYRDEGVHPWRGTTSRSLNPFTLEQLENWTHNALRSVTYLSGSLEEWPVGLDPTSVSVTQLMELVKAVEQLPERLAPTVVAALTHLAAASDVMELRRLKEVSVNLACLGSQLQHIVDNPTQIRPELEAIAAVSKDVDDETRRRSTEIAVADLEAELHQLEVELAGLRQCGQIVAELDACVTDEIPPTFETLRHFLDLAALANDAGSEILLARTEELVSHHAADALKKARRREQELRAEAQELENTFAFSRSLGEREIEDCERAGRILSQAGYFAILTKDYRWAKRFYRRLLKRKQKFDRKRAAAGLRGLAAYGGAVQEFETDPSFTIPLGAAFKGIQSDFGGMQAVVHFGEQVRHRFAEVGVKPLRELLLTGHSESILSLAAYASASQVESVEALLAKSPPANHIDRDCIALSKLKALLQAVYDVSSRVELRPTATIDAVLTVPDLCKQIESLEESRGSLGTAFKILGIELGADVDLETIDQIANYWDRCNEPAVVPEVRHCLLSAAANDNLTTAHAARESCEAAARDTIAAIEDALTIESVDLCEFFGDQWKAVSLSAVVSRLAMANQAREALQPWVRRNMVAHTLGESVAAELFEALSAVPVDERPDLRRAFEYVVFRTLAKEAYGEYPRLAEYGGTKLLSIRDKFRDLDKRILQLSQKRLAADLTRRTLDHGNGVGRKSEYTELSLIQHEISKQRRHLPIRELMRRAGTAVQQLKPCFMMSPLSVAQYLKPDGVAFDLVVIDEASQMRPEDSLSAVVRGAQLVVVGDPMQLPPTSFFDRQEDLEVEDIDDLPDDESILDLALGVFRPARDLRWHYRSRDDRLITFSNHQFYDDKLIVAPRAHDGKGEGPRTGVIVHDPEFRGMYRASVNVEEAQLVAGAVREFMHRHPSCSLGVVAMNQAQRSLIAAEIESLVLGSREMSSYIDEWDQTISPFFVKNLENVQGDERDVIFISTVYGPDADGRVMQRFGPVNMALGHRRLNVLFTRARSQVRLFTSLRSSDMTVAEGASPGVRALAGYLEYAFTGRIERGYVSDRESNDFETWVRDALRAKGYEVDTEVGARGYFIDLAVKHPAYPHGYLVGIECDGATYHSSKSARDRDRLRQEVLEGLGWTIYRVWSTDWFADPRREIGRLVEFIERTALQLRTQRAATEVVPADRGARRVVAPPQEVPTATDADGDATTPPGDVSDLDQIEAEARIQVGDTVEIEYEGESGQTKKVMIVAPSAVPEDGQIGAGSPLARAILGSGEGDECSFNVGDRDRYVKVVRITKGSHKSAPPSTSAFTLRAVPTTNPLDFGQPEAVVTGAESAVETYREWSVATPIQDPREEPSGPVAEGLLKIVAVEGPILVGRLFRRYANAAGIQRVGRQVKNALNQVLYTLRKERRVLESKELGGSGQKDLIIRLPNQPCVRLRDRGNRLLEEIPPSEIGALIADLKQVDRWLGREELFRRVLSTYGLSRLTNSARKHLEIALQSTQAD